MLRPREAVRRPSNSSGEERSGRSRRQNRRRQNPFTVATDGTKGNYHNDYSPRYGKPYDIYEKARSHVKKLKQNQSKSE